MQVKPADELGEIFSDVNDVLEAAAAMSSPSKGRAYVIKELEQLRERMEIPASNGRKSDGEWAGLVEGAGGLEEALCPIVSRLSSFCFRFAANSPAAHGQVLHVPLGKGQFR